MEVRHEVLFSVELEETSHACRFRCWMSLLSSGILLQATAGGCEQSLSGIAAAIGQPIAAGIENGRSSLVEALV